LSPAGLAGATGSRARSGIMAARRAGSREAVVEGLVVDVDWAEAPAAGTRALDNPATPARRAAVPAGARA
jgi:hypothetical protein